MIGILGGTFDPTHLGHLHLAKEVLSQRSLKEVWFCPAFQSPHKESSPTAPSHRKKMCELAIKGHPKFQLIDWELKRGGPSYMIETIQQIKKAYPKETFALVISDELVPTLPRWKGIHELLDEVTLLVGRRGYENSLETGDSKIDQAVKKGYIDMAILDICATEIRNKVKGGEDYSSLVSPVVFNYIHKHKLYQ